MERRGLKVNLEKTKMVVTGGEVGDVVRVGRYPCGVCGCGVGANSVLCTACGKWCHKRCLGPGMPDRSGSVSFPVTQEEVAGAAATWKT